MRSDTPGELCDAVFYVYPPTLLGYTPGKVTPMVEKSLKGIDFDTLCHGPFHPSPAAWEDQVFYFLLLDRFSDGQEQGYRDNGGQIVAGGTTPLLCGRVYGPGWRLAEQTEGAKRILLS